MAGVSLQWTSNDLLTLFCTLNLRIEDVRAATKEDNKKGLVYAAQLVSQEIGDGCTPARVERKIKQLWTSYGDPEGGKEPYNICLYGAFPKTLPGVSSTLFSAVTSRVEELQRCAEAPKASSGAAATQLAQTRRSRRRVASSNCHDDPVCCRCGFTHNILWVHCDGCATWHHAYCYYDTEDETKLPDIHMCDDCKLIEEGPLSQSLSHLHIQLGKQHEKRSRELQQQSTVQQNSSPTQSLGPFGLPIDEEVMWGPNDQEIHSYLDIITSQLRNVANFLEPELDISETGVSWGNNPDTLLLVQTAVKLDDAFWLWPEILDPARHRPKRRQLLRAFLAAAMSSWIFHVPDAQPASYESILLLHYQEEVFHKHDIRLLESLHRRAFIRMMEDRSPFREFVAREAEKLSDRCIGAILPITIFGRHCPSPSVRDWVASHPVGIATRERLIQAFSLAMKLKQWLPLAGKCFELYTPLPGCTPTEGHTVKPDDLSTKPNQVVKLCLMPGVVEYLPDIFLSGSPGPHALCGQKNLVRASEEQRNRGRVICPAIVITEDKDSNNI